MAEHESSAHEESPLKLRPRYEGGMAEIRAAFEASTQRPEAGAEAIAARSKLVDEIVLAAWTATAPLLRAGVALVAAGGYGRGELFPYSDVDLMVLLDPKLQEKTVKEPIRQLNQALWDAGLRVSAMTRTLAECERFNPENVEFTLSLLDARFVAGDQTLVARLLEKALPQVIARDRKKIIGRLLDVTATRHAKYGDTLFHLEPNIKECPGGLRDAHVSAWLARLSEAPPHAVPEEFDEARIFLLLTRTFLHYRHGRDDNTLDWLTQDAASAAPLGALQPGVDAAYWMRLYFRQARAIERGVQQAIEEALPPKPSLLATLRGDAGQSPYPGVAVRQNRVEFAALDATGEADPARDPDIALAIFASMAKTGATLARDSERRLERALPRLSSNLEDGPVLWGHLGAILMGDFAGRALRAMHALGILELLIPEFHGIDALVIRDAYHRYTVDEHTFVVIDTLHALNGKPQQRTTVHGAGPVRTANFSGLLRDLPRPSLLYFAALLHDTGKGHSGVGHAAESVRMAGNLLDRLDFDAQDKAMVLDLIGNHLEMSAALRRDVFDVETVRAFAARVGTPEALRMLTLFTFADISAVHPDALTPWKAENLWNLYMATANFLDRHVDDERVGSSTAVLQFEEIVRGMKKDGGESTRHLQVMNYVKGFPHRYLQTRTSDQIRTHLEMAARLPPPGEDGPASMQLDFRFALPASELTLVTHDRPMLFAMIAGALAAWGMNIVTADAFTNAQGIVVDSFRFTDGFRTLELNESERERFVASVHNLLCGTVTVDTLLASRRRGRRKPAKINVETRVDLDLTASTQSTLIQVVAQDTPGLLRALSLVIAQAGCNIEVALIDTEGEMAIDVFYITQAGAKLEPGIAESLRTALVEAIEANAR